MSGTRKIRAPSRDQPIRSTALVPLLWLTLSVLGCSAGAGDNAAPAWRYPGFDPRDSLRYPVSWRDDWELEQVALLDHLPPGAPQVPNPSEPSGPADPGTAAAPPGTPSARQRYRGFIGDMLGSRRPELVLATPRGFTVYALDGSLRARYSAPLNSAAPAFLMDFDGDRKLDLLLGSVAEAQPTFLVVNGMGRLVYRYRITDNSRDFGSLIPVLAEGDAVYLLAEEHWVDSPRGFIRYSASRQEEDWTFRVPGNPLDLRPVEAPTSRPDQPASRFVVSYATRSTGFASSVGREPARELRGIDALTRLIEFGASGCTHAVAPVRDGNLPVSGNAQFYPLPETAPGDYLLRLDRLDHPGAGPDEHAALSFSVVEKGPGAGLPARVLSRVETTVGSVLDFRIVTVEGAVGFLFLVREGRRYFLEFRDGALELQARRLIYRDGAAAAAPDGAAVGPVAVHLGPVLQGREEGASPSLLLLTPGKLHLLDANLRIRTLAEVSGGRQVLVNLGAQGGRLVVLGRENVIYRVQPVSGTVD